MGLFGGLLNWLRSLFWSKSMDIACIGLQNAGKTSLVNILTNNQFSESMIPTVGFNLRKIQKGNVVSRKLCDFRSKTLLTKSSRWTDIKDLAGQPRFRSIWERYCRGVNAIVWVLDSADRETFSTSRAELHALLEKPELKGIPLLVLANKNDLADHATVDEVISALALATIRNREVSCYSISAKSSRNIDITLAWLMKRA
ncbi:hypothetical protein NBRC10512v2_007597 [Rhodotorula toruloides]